AIQNDRVTTSQNEGVKGWKGERVQAPPLTPSPLHPLTLSSPLIGRDAELHHMQQLYHQVGPNGRLLIIEGEPGIGKTRLAEALVAWATANGATTLTARCYE